ncbi:MAG: hypothetical protein GY699_10535, partial [Desulfobacteraceae bacterium]|nr:hypothetical protein [Desulfobacteraceae bacterium]
LEKVVFHLGQWRFFFTKPGIIPSDFGDDIWISVDADTLEVSISGMNPIEFARTAIASAGFDAPRAKFDIINPVFGKPSYDRKLPVGVTRDLLRSHWWVVRAMEVEGCINPLWIIVKKKSMKVVDIFEAPDPEG